MLTCSRHLNGHTERLPKLRPDLLGETGSLYWIDLEDASEAEAGLLSENRR